MKLLAHISIRSAVIRNILGPPIPPGCQRRRGVSWQRWEWKRKSCQGPIEPALAAGATAFYRLPNIKTSSADGNRSNFSRFAFPAMEGYGGDGKLGGIDQIVFDSSPPAVPADDSLAIALAIGEAMMTKRAMEETETSQSSDRQVNFQDARSRKRRSPGGWGALRWCDCNGTAGIRRPGWPDRASALSSNRDLVGNWVRCCWP
jgi:hypothetical protein